MPIDWSEPDFVYLRTQLKVGRPSLFAGAGFSLDAKNQFNESLPLGAALAELLAAKACVEFRGESLPTVFEAVRSIIGEVELWKYLAALYTTVSCENWYRIAMTLTWNRVYTTNIDNLFQFLQPYGSGQTMNIFVRGDLAQERDSHFESLQCVHLHGHVFYRQNGLTFTQPDLATHTARPDPWYQTLIDDLTRSPMVFIGTQLEEPILAHYLDLREKKPHDKNEYRPKSYLISPNISPIRAGSLKGRNIVPVSCTAREFFESFASTFNIEDFTLDAVQCAVWPYLFPKERRIRSDVTRFFDPIIANSLPPVKAMGTSRFFLGAEPTWDDIGRRRDAPREITTTVFNVLADDMTVPKCVVLHGHSGSGKSTTMMRLAHDLAAAGKQVLFALGLERIDFDPVIKLADSLGSGEGKLYVFVDVLSRHIAAITARLSQISDCQNIVLVVADQTNRYHTKCQRLGGIDPSVFPMPDLTEPDVRSVIAKLAEFGFLGVLKNKTDNEQINAFLDRANRQLLVALREATSGKDFDLILEGEFGDLAPEAQLAYAICCIAVSQGAPGVYTKHLLPCIPKSQFAKGMVVEDLLRGVLVPANYTHTMVKPRHPVIARFVAEEIVPAPMKYTAITRFLVQVSSQIVPNDIKRRSPAYLAYRGMVHSEGLYKLFSADMTTILQLYEDVRPYYSDDSLFWLQFAMAHIKAGHLDVAENFLNQSLNIHPHSFQAQHQMGVLCLLQALSEDDPSVGLIKAKQGMEKLEHQMRDRGMDDSYPYHAYLTYVGRWYAQLGSAVSDADWEALRAVGRVAKDKYRLADDIRDAVRDVETLYLKRIVARQQDLD